MSLRTVHMLGLPVPLIAALLVSAAVPSVDAQCCRNAPGNCSFSGTVCRWSGRYWSNLSSYTYLSRQRLSGSLTSKYRCVSSAVSHCLQFEYYLKNSNYSLTVYISHRGNNSQIQLWKTSGVAKWKTVQIAVKTDSTFRLIIKGTRNRKERNKHVRIKNLVYNKNGCSNEQVSTTTAHSVTNNSSADGLAGAADPSTHVGVVVGVVLAAVIIVCLIVTLIVFLRWKQLMCWKLQHDDKQTAVQVCFKGEACGASSNAGTTRNDNYTELDIADASRPHCYSSLREVRASQISMENYSAVRDVSGDPSTLAESTAALYELAQPVLPSAPNGLVNSGFQCSLDSLYDGGQNILQHQEDGGHSDHNVACFNKRDGKEHTEPVYSNQPSYNHIHSACKSDTEGKGRLGKMEKDPRMLSHPSLEDKALHELGGEASDVYHVLEETEKQNPQVKPASAYQVAKTPLAEVSMRQELEHPATSVCHNLEDHGTTSHSGPEDKSTAVLHSTEDITSSHPDPDDTYHILEAESTPQPPPHTTEEIYQNLTETLPEENAACDSRDIIHKSTLPTKPESSPLPCEAAYNRLRFDKTGAVFADKEEGGGVGDEIYSHLKEGGEGTYDEVRREGRRDVIDEDYSHI